MFRKLPEKSRHSERVNNVRVRQLPLFHKIIKNRRKYAAGPAGWSRNHHPVVRIFFTRRVSEGADLLAFQNLRMRIGQHGFIEAFCFSLDPESAGKRPRGCKPPLDRAFHRIPHLREIVPDFRSLVHFHIIHEIDVAETAELFDFRKGILKIKVLLFLRGRSAFNKNISAPDALHPHFRDLRSVPVGEHVKCIRMPQVVRIIFRKNDF